MKILMFLGSGISFPSNVPGVEKITHEVIWGDWYGAGDGRFYRGPAPSAAPDLIPRIQPLLRWLKVSADEYFSLRRPQAANYEDVYYLCQQIADDLQGEVDNPAALPFLQEAKDRLAPLLGPRYEGDDGVSLARLANSAMIFIKCVVQQLIGASEPTTPVGLTLVREIAEWTDCERLFIATTNYDRLLEKELAGTAFADCVGEVDGDVEWLNPDVFDNASMKIHLYKLHGDRGWYMFRRESGGQALDRYGRSKQPYVFDSKAGDGVRLDPLLGTPVMLAGTYNKPLSYGIGLFTPLHTRFTMALEQCNTMIVSGYGWNDRGLNHRLIEWLMTTMDKRLFLLHEKPESLKQARSPLWHQYDKLVTDGRLVPVPKWLQAVKLDELKELFSSHNAH